MRKPMRGAESWWFWFLCSSWSHSAISSSHSEDHIKVVRKGWSHCQRNLKFVLDNSSTMRFLWLSLLLIGSITCAPQKPGDESGYPMWQYMAAQQNPSMPVQQNPSGQDGGSGGLIRYPHVYYSGSDSGSTHGAQQGSQQGAPGPYQFAEESWSSSSDPSVEDEPVITPVDEEDQVYAYKSKSRYNRKQLRFNQFRYTPTEQIVVQPPMFPPREKNPPGHKGY